MKDMTTTKSFFGDVQDITHKPKRLQGQNFVGTDVHLNRNADEVPQQKQDIPDFITLERAINYYESNSNSVTSEGKLYAVTANFLRELLDFRASKIRVTDKRGESSDSTFEHTETEVHTE